MSSGRQPELKLGGGVVLRPWRSADAPQIVIGTRDPAVRRYAAHLVDDRTDALEALHRWIGGWEDATGVGWAITEAGDTVVGSLRFGITDRHVGVGAVGYWLVPESRGRGIATRALTAGTDVVFRDLGWHRIELSHAVENERSCAVARRAGYRAEGVLRGAMFYPDGARRSDEHLHARLTTD